MYIYICILTCKASCQERIENGFKPATINPLIFFGGQKKMKKKTHVSPYTTTSPSLPPAPVSSAENMLSSVHCRGHSNCLAVLYPLAWA